MDQLKLESRRYIGSKTKLLGWIMDVISREAKGSCSFFDVFGGTGVVSKFAQYMFDEIIINDFLYSNYVAYNAFFKGRITKKVKNKLAEYNNLDIHKIKDNYFSRNFGDKYFSNDVAKIIGHIREDIEKNKSSLTSNEYFTMLTSLMYSMDKIANTVGHYDAYIKKAPTHGKFTMHLVEKLTDKDIKIYCEDSNELVKKVKTDIAYIDPPYNSRQYERFYHLWENLSEWVKPELFGTALKPNPKKISKYCQVSAKEVFADLIKNIDAKYIVVSYNNTYNSKSNSSRNKMTFDDILEILYNKGETKVFDQAHKYFSAGKTDFEDHKEYLFVTKVNN